MPRTKRPAGQVVDRRNGRRAELEAAGGPLAKFALPKRSDGDDYDLRTKRMYAALWLDPVSSVLSVIDREIVIRWAQSVDDWMKALVKAHADPIATGSMGQEVPSPWFSIAKQALDVAEKCEAQIGVGALNRARLGLAVIEQRKSLEELNARLRRPVTVDGEVVSRRDPRVSR